MQILVLNFNLRDQKWPSARLVHGSALACASHDSAVVSSRQPKNKGLFAF